MGYVVRLMKDLLQELKTNGERAFLAAHKYPVLLGFGLAGKMEKPQHDKQQVTQPLTRAVNVGALLESALMWKDVPIELRPGPCSCDTNQVRVGRTAYMDVILPDFSISRHHCTFEWKDGAMMLRDADSRNGTLVGNRPAGKVAYLRGGEILTLGRLVFQYLTAEGLVQRLRETDKKTS